MTKRTNHEKNVQTGTNFTKLIVVGFIILILYLLGSAASKKPVEMILLTPFLW